MHTDHSELKSDSVREKVDEWLQGLGEQEEWNGESLTIDTGFLWGVTEMFCNNSLEGF